MSVADRGDERLGPCCDEVGQSADDLQARTDGRLPPGSLGPCAPQMALHGARRRERAHIRRRWRGHQLSFRGSWPQFMSEKRQRVSVTSPLGRCALWRCT